MSLPRLQLNRARQHLAGHYRGGALDIERHR